MWQEVTITITTQDSKEMTVQNSALEYLVIGAISKKSLVCYVCERTSCL